MSSTLTLAASLLIKNLKAMRVLELLEVEISLTFKDHQVLKNRNRMDKMRLTSSTASISVSQTQINNRQTPMLIKVKANPSQ